MNSLQQKKPISRRRRAVFAVIITLASLAFLEGVARALFAMLPSWERRRLLLGGELAADPTVMFQFSIGQAYLLYIPAPNYQNSHGLQHNSQGYRGTAVPMDRVPGVARVLCLGGSTTYSWGVDDSAQTYPAHLEQLLAANLPPGWKNVEVINAGAPWATTAEMLTYYHFKFHYYKPDLVILNPGGNDAEGLTMPYYHPDYSNWRQPMSPPRSLPPRSRNLLRSRLAAIFLIGLLYEPNPDTTFVRLDGQPPLAQWYPRSSANPSGEFPRIPEEELAFKHNLDELIDEIQKDGAKVLLVPFRAHPLNHYTEGVRRAMEQEERILKDIAVQRRLPFAPFPAEVISPQNWIDEYCHVNGEGNREKALHILPYALRALEQVRRVKGAGV